MGKQVILIGLLALLAAGCNGAPQEDGSSTAPRQAKPAADHPQAQFGNIGALVDALVSGEGQELASALMDYAPYERQAHSFLEYPDPYRAGQKYGWGDFERTVEDFCVLRMLNDYTAAQLSVSLGWFAGYSGYSVAQLREQFMELHYAAGGTVAEHHDTAGAVLGKVYNFEGKDYRARLLTWDGRDDRYDIFSMMVRPEAVVALADANDQYTELLLHGTEDSDNTIGELVAVAAERGATGLLERFDFGYFINSIWYAPLEERDERDFTQTTIYHIGAWKWDNPGTCYLAAFDDGSRVQFVFTSDWYSRHGGYDGPALDAQFEALLVEHGGRSVTLPALDPRFRVDYAWCYVDGVNVVRRRYANPPAGLSHHAHYTLLAGEAELTDAPPSFPGWSTDDLPVLLPETGPFAGYLHYLATTPVDELVREHFVGFVQEDYFEPLNQLRPYSLRHYLYFDDELKYRTCHLDILDWSYLAWVEVMPGWLETQRGIVQGELEDEYWELYDRYRDAGPLAGAPALPELDPELQQEEVFYYGPLRISRIPGNYEDARDSRYRIEFPVWP